MTDEQQILTVSEITSQIKHLLENSFRSVWVCGEVSSLSIPQSGHAYFTLKDEHSQIRAVIWRNALQRMKFELQSGLEIVCRASVDVYGPRGTYQLSIQSAEPMGLGALQLAFRQLHAKLEARGWFDPQYKKPLPRYPKRIAFVTSPTGAAVRDFLQVLRRRWNMSQLLIIPARVQGDGSAVEIARGIEIANQLTDRPDLLVVGRGGGSMEDLWAFNEEPVIRAIFESEIPVISSVGHEIDVTLSDLVADRRALTPSEAAEIAVPNRIEIATALSEIQPRMRALLIARLQSARGRLNQLATSRVLRDPRNLVKDQILRLDETSALLHRQMKQKLQFSRHQTDLLAGKLDAISPLAVLSRGYSITTNESGDVVVIDARQVEIGDRLKTRLESGSITSNVVEVETEL